ncbi:MAG TPA: hypothetical protein VM658_05625 [bacterium]|nr:hypothetical protein [bacterium]
MKFPRIFKMLRHEQADPRKAALAVACLGFLVTAAALKMNSVSPETQFRIALSEQAFMLLATGQAVTGFLLFIASLGIYLGRSWGRRLGQASLIIIFAGVLYLLFTWYVAGGDQVLDDDGWYRILSALFALLLAAPTGIIFFFGLRYLERLPR